jgi:hypothetical protein
MNPSISDDFQIFSFQLTPRECGFSLFFRKDRGKGISQFMEDTSILYSAEGQFFKLAQENH